MSATNSNVVRHPLYFCVDCYIVGTTANCPRCEKESTQLTEKQVEEYIKHGYKALLPK